ncbi:MAG: aldo/keto reductase [Caldisericota bacterium]|nr:aldo/keto reductase [Caldisericota bacterium]
MQYRRLGRCGVKVSVLGFGCMRFPTVGGDNAQIDEPQATEMLRYAIDNGVNYIDTAYLYHGGKSESFVGRALQNGYRERAYLATKMPVWLVEKYEDFDRFFNEQLERLQTDHIDFYLMHALNKERWEKIVNLDVIKWIEVEKAKGRIRHIGFSFHDSFDSFVKIIDDYDRWEFCQVQYNYMNEEFQAGNRGLKYAFSKGVGVIVMEPVLGGDLENPPEIINSIWNEARTKRTPTEWALQWVWNKPEVSIVLSGMKSVQQVIENLESADLARVDKFTQEELDIIARVRDKYREIQPILCSDCGYCMPCPYGVDIPHNFILYNIGKMYNKMPRIKQWFALMKENGSSAVSCIQCGQCEEKCPQDIKIMEWLATIAKELK